MRRGLGVNITNDMVNDFFSPGSSVLRQNNTQVVRENHFMGNLSSSTSRGASGIATPRYSADEKKFYEQQMTLSAHCDEEPLSPTVPPSTSEMLLPEPVDCPHVLNENQQEISTEIYDNYSFDHQYDNTLPISDKRQELITAIESSRVTIIQGSTGSGKTTQVPQYILDYYRRSHKYCNILVTQPRRIAAISVAKRVSEERNWQLGTLVGYQVAREKNISEDTRISYVTTGVLLQKMIKNKNLGDYTHIILDEVHERDQTIDFSMLVIRKFLRNVFNVKVILMSATVDCSLFSNYFSTLINGKQEGAPIIRVDGRMFSVTEYYFEDISGLSEPPKQSIFEPAISEKCYQLCRELIMRLDKDELEDEYQVQNFAEKRGTVLCFLPGLPEIKEMHKFLADLEEKYKLKVIPLHSLVTTVEQNKVFIPAKPRERKVILSTNIAESSITVPDIKYVIDFCLTKQNETDTDTNYQRLTLQWASQASLTQRKGRAGRVSEGHCFRMISSAMYPQLFEYCQPEMLRAPLEQLILQVKLLDLGPPAMILQLAIQPPNISDVKRTILTLKEVGALTVHQNGKINSLDGDLTFVGRVLGSMPVDVRIGKLLLIGYAFGVLEECCIIAACLSLKSIFSRPFRKELMAYSNKMHWAKFSNSDLLATLHAFMSWKFRKEKKGFGEREKKWAERNMLEGRRFREVNELAKELKDRLASFNIQAQRNIHKREDIDEANEFLLKLVIAGAFYPNYFLTNTVDESEALKQISGQNPFTTIVVNGAPPTLCHYRSNVAHLFRACGRGKRLFFENSRAFIEFENNDNNGESPVAVAVYKAIKMRHLRIPLNILVSKKKDDEFRAELVDNPLEAFNPETGLKTNRVNTQFNDKAGKFSVTMAGDPKRVAITDSGYVSIFVQEIVTPGQFWATYADQETRQLMFQLHNKINCFGGSNLKPLRREDIYLGSYCLAPFQDEFHRAEIILFKGSCVQVFFLDYGNKELIEVNNLRACSDALLDIPFQAFLCELSGLRTTHGTWSEDAHERFKELVPVGSKDFIAKVYSVVHDACRVTLFDGDVSINRMLIEEGYACEQEEPLISKNKHDEPLGMRKNVEMNEKYIPDSPLHFRGDEVLKISLRGPFSPYELGFHGMTASSKLRATRVEQDSVNSVVICEEPQDKRPRFMVAAVINANSSGNAIIARETTLYPNIHGLNSLIPLVFAPVAEMRYDKDKTKYTGALCGLGFTGRGNPILPDHDLEVVFDVNFTVEDLYTINAIRMLLNSAIGIEEEKVDKAHKQIVLIQNHLKEKLINLVTKQRTDMEPIYFKREYQWDQISEEDLLKETGYESIPNHLFMYHKGIFFEEKPMPEDPRVVAQRKQLEELHKLAGSSLTPFKTEVVCGVCNVICPHPRAVYIHCDTPMHTNWVKTFFKK